MYVRRTVTLARATGVLALVFLFLPAPAQSLEMPSFRRAAPVQRSTSTPTSVASAPDGRMYVVEPLQSDLLVYGPGGEFQQTVSGFSRPISVALGPQGRVFVGDAVQARPARSNSRLRLRPSASCTSATNRP